MSDSEKVDKLTHAVERVERMLGEKAVKHSVQAILDQQQAQQDMNTIAEAAEGYSSETPQEQRMAAERAQIRGVLFDPQVVEFAQKHNISAEMLTEKLLEKGPQAFQQLRGEKVGETVAGLVGLKPKEPEGDSFFGVKPGVKSTPTQIAKLEELQKQGKGDDDTLKEMIKVVFPDDF